MEPSNELRQALKEYKEGKSEAFTTLYEESSKYVYTCIYKVMSGNDNVQDIINDIMQDTYVEISKYITQLEDEEKFLSWAGTIATRKCYAYLKKNKKYVLLNEEDNTFENLSDSDSIIPEEVMQDREKQRLVREIIETQLTEMQKLCITAYYYNDKKQSEIAEELGIPENTVKTNLSRAKAKIKDGVLDLEKREGTKLYSVAPFLLLLFKEDVQAAVVPKEVTESIMSAVSEIAGAGVGAASKGIIGKIASASLKTKIIAGVVAVGVLGGVAGTVYVVGQQREESVANETVIVNDAENQGQDDFTETELENTENTTDSESVVQTEGNDVSVETVNGYQYTEGDLVEHEYFYVVDEFLNDHAPFDPYINEAWFWECEETGESSEYIINGSLNIYSNFHDEGIWIGYTKENVEVHVTHKPYDWVVIRFIEKEEDGGLWYSFMVKESEFNAVATKVE